MNPRTVIRVVKASSDSNNKGDACPSPKESSLENSIVSQAATVKKVNDKSVDVNTNKVPKLISVSQCGKILKPLIKSTDIKTSGDGPSKPACSMIYIYDFSKMVPYSGRIEVPQTVTIAEKSKSGDSSNQHTDTKISDVTTNQNESQTTPIANQMILSKNHVVQSSHTFKCAYCDYTSHNKNYLKQHVDLVHTADRPYKCPFCDYAGKRSHSLREHLIVHSNDRPYQCPHCNATFRKKGHLTNHEKLHQKTVNCQICQMSFPSTDIEAHLKENHKGKESQGTSEIPKKVEKRLEKAQDTATRMNATKVYICSECKGMFKDFNQFVKHAETHTATEQVKAAESAKTEKTVEDKKNLKMMKCSECGFISGDQDDMNKHLWSHINNSLKPVPFSSSSTTPTHDLEGLKTASEVKTLYKCSECSLVFEEDAAYKAHMSGHESIKPQHIATEVEGESMSSEKTPTGQIVGEGLGPPLNSNIGQSTVSHMKTILVRTLQDGSLTTSVEKAPASSPDILTNEQKVHVVQKTLTVKGTEELSFVLDDQLARFRCTACGYTCNYEGTMKSHILKHHGNKEKAEDDASQMVKATSSEQPIYVGKVVPSNGASKVSEPPFVLDHQSARFRCTICGYTCEYQRTIKAHIWKHSGNKDIDYPIFQNGPLSIYDDWTPFFIEEKKSHTGKTLVPNTAVHLQKSLKKESPEEIAQRLCTSVETIKVKSSAISPVAPALANFLAMRARQKVDEPLDDVEEESILKQTSDGSETIIHVKNLEKEANDTVLTVKVSPDISESAECCKGEKSVRNNDEVEGVDSSSRLDTNLDATLEETHIQCDSSQEMEISETTVSITNTEENIAEIVQVCTTDEAKLPLKRKSPISSTEEEGEMQQVAKRLCSDTSARDYSNTGVLVEPVDSYAEDTFTGLRSEINSPKPEDCSQDHDSGVASECLASPRSSTTLSSAKREKFSQEGESVEDFAPINEEEECVDDQPITIDINVTRTRSSRERTTSESMAESAVTLLSLLQKGPNLNPACPVQRSDDKGTSNDESPNSVAPLKESDGKQSGFGISSSLLAVIEQLRERSKDSEVFETDDGTLTRKSAKRRIKKESQEAMSSIATMENVEKISENKQEKYRCKLCHYSNSSTYVMLQHMRLHKEKKPSECSLCEFIASSSEDLQDHMIKHCKVRTYQCKLCPSAFNYKSQLRAHMRAHNDKEVFVCDECDFESNNPAAFRNHVRGHSEKKLYKCEVCDRSFLSKPDLKNHKKGECSKQKSFNCDECDFVAIGPHEQKLHAKLHAKELSCAYCDFVTTSLTKFQSHTKTHEEPTSLKCEFCDFPAVSTRSLKSHMKRHINDQRFVQQPLEQYKCNLCGYVCHHLPSLKSHMWRHASDASYSYQFTNEVINAAIDYDCRLDAQGCKEEDIAEFSQTIRTKLMERLVRQGEDADVNTKAVCWVTFRCCQCGFETINKAQLSMHMKGHSDVIKWTLQVSSV